MILRMTLTSRRMLGEREEEERPGLGTREAEVRVSLKDMSALKPEVKEK